MIRTIYAIFDLKAGEFVGPIMLFPSDASAVRVFTDTLRSGDNTISQHPEDYELCKLGAFNAASGELEGLASPRHPTNIVLSGSDWFANQMAAASHQQELGNGK